MDVSNAPRTVGLVNSCEFSVEERQMKGNSKMQSSASLLGNSRI